MILTSFWSPSPLQCPFTSLRIVDIHWCTAVSRHSISISWLWLDQSSNSVLLLFSKSVVELLLWLMERWLWRSPELLIVLVSRAVHGGLQGAEILWLQNKPQSSPLHWESCENFSHKHAVCFPSSNDYSVYSIKTWNSCYHLFRLHLFLITKSKFFAEILLIV